MNGQLRGDLLAQLLQWEQDADLCLTLGTSLAGMNADRVAVSCGQRAQEGNGLGTVIINLQRTKQDHLSSLRIFGHLDAVLAAVAERLGVPPAAYADPASQPAAPSPPAAAPAEDGLFHIPYDEAGRRVRAGPHRALDLREGARVVITAGPYKGDEGVVRARRRDGHYDIAVQHRVSAKLVAQVPVLLGSWFVEGALAGDLASMPVASLPASEPAAAAAAGDRTDGAGAAAAGAARRLRGA
jgi:hypothetical protein